VELVVIKFITERKFKNRDAEKLRGYFGNIFKDQIMFHNHLSKYQFLYTSPKIQYKVIEGYLSIVGIEEGVKVLENNVSDITNLIIQDKVVKVLKIEKSHKNFTLDIHNEQKYIYNLDTLWLALNQTNYKKYKDGNFDLDKNLRNNIIEFFKLCGLWADKEIKVKGAFKEEVVMHKNNKTLAFSGWFVTNVELPDYIGLGKRKSIGYGTIKKI